MRENKKVPNHAVRLSGVLILVLAPSCGGLLAVGQNAVPDLSGNWWRTQDRSGNTGRVAEQAPRGAQQPRVPAPGQPFSGFAVTRLHQRDEPFVIAPTGFRLGRWGRGGLTASHMGIVAAAARMVQSCARFVPRFLT